jgi:hypothetical protein
MWQVAALVEGIRKGVAIKPRDMIPL